MKKTLVLIVTLYAMAAAADEPPKNIAHGAPYQMDPAPGYEHCTDADDARQLTDGRYVEGYFWTQPGTVGWQNANPVLITVDLGSDQPIRGVSFNTAAGTAGVHWPTAILIFVAGEDKTFRVVGELTQLSAVHGMPPADGYGVHRYWTDQLRTHGRYVALGVWSQPFVFSDEIEVYAGAPEWVNAPVEGVPVQDLKTYIQRMAIYDGVMRRLRDDLATVREKAEKAQIDADAKQKAVAELDAAAAEMHTVKKEYDASFRTVLPLNTVHERIFRAQAHLWTGVYFPSLYVWTPPNPYEFLGLFNDPPRDADPKIRVEMMQNEYRAAAINFSNTGLEPVSMQVSVRGLPGGPNPPWVTLHEVLWTDTAQGVPVAAALAPAPPQSSQTVYIPAGMTRQVWLTFHSIDVAPGHYEGELYFDGPDLIASGYPITVHIYPVRFPDRPRLHLGGWDYTDQTAMYQVTPENRTALVDHLRARYVDSPWGTSATMPHGKYDAAGNLTEPPDTKHFDAWLELWPNAAQYCVFASVGDHIGSFQMGTPEFDTAVGAWVRFWAEHARERNVQPRQLAVLLVDEPSQPEQDAVILEWAQAIRAADTGIRVWEDPVHQDMTKANPDMVAACHVLCPNRQIFLKSDDAYRDYFARRRDEGIALEFYSCSGPARLLDPYSYYRLQAWTCWQHGASSMYFWAYGDGGGAFSSNEYVSNRNGYTPLFIDAAGVMPGKHMEAIREGVEDFEYLALLNEAVTAAGDANSPTLARARRLLEEAPRRVLAPTSPINFTWRRELDRTIADTVRIELLQAIEELGRR